MNVFISHSSKDADCAMKICGLLEQAGHQCFIAPRDIPAGKEYAGEIMLGIERSQVMVLILSESSNSSPHVMREVEHAASRSVPIAVYKMEEVKLNKSMEYFLMTHQWLNQKAGEDLGTIVKAIDNLEREARRLPAENKVPKPKSRKAFVPIAAAVIVLALLAAGVVFRLNKRDDTGQQATTIKLGDTVILGSYDQEPVTWRVVHLSEDGRKAVLITEHIISMKAYDAAGSSRYNMDNGEDYWSYNSDDFQDRELEARVRGNSDWEASNIRTWLNSDKENVSYEGDRPTSLAMSELKNGYENEAGFLSGFTEEERAAILETRLESKGNLLAEKETQVTVDKVFLLNLEELKWLEEADVSLFATPTGAAVARDGTGWYRLYSLDYGVEAYYWWLRETAEDSVSRCYIVTNGLSGDAVSTQIVGTEGFGIRPAVTIDVEAFAKLQSQAEHR